MNGCSIFTNTQSNSTFRLNKRLRIVKLTTLICRIAAGSMLLGMALAVPASEQAKPSKMSKEAKPADVQEGGFRPDPTYEDKPYSAEAQLEIYGAKRALETPRPLLELGQRIYDSGPLRRSTTPFGAKNPVKPELTVYGDWRTALAFNDNGAKEIGQIATRLNLDIDLKLTGTERLHAFVRPLDRGGKFTRCEFAGNDEKDGCELEFDGNIDALFFEGDLGAIMSGINDHHHTYDLPFAVGLMPLLFQNGVWLEDAFTGLAFTIPALNSRWLDISNMDITFFAGFDKVSSGGIINSQGQVADHDANLYGITAFIEAQGGYIELGYGLTDGIGALDEQSYNNFTAAFSRRYGNWLSNSTRIIWNTGQHRKSGTRQTADGVVLLFENSWITSMPSTLVPYLNVFLGLDRPQSLARDAGAGGILKNTGINFETDGLTGFPKLDDSANDAFGGAIGVEYLFSLDQQIVVELATVQVFGNRTGKVAPGDQYAVGVRYQRPITKAWLVRADAMYATRRRLDNLAGIRLELRRKF
ncbi:MAG: hypothetical protein ACI8W7_000062 [Gammaproteobacteria bacterium]|jgi:hypothetical protein